MQRLQGPTTGARRLAFSPAGDKLVVSYDNGSIRVWQPATGTSEKWSAGGGTPKFLIWRPDGERFASAIGPEYGGAVYWYVTPHKIDALTYDAPEIGTACLSADGSTLLVPTRDAILRWDTYSSERRPAWPAASPEHLAASADGKWVASTHPASSMAAGYTHHVAVRDATTGGIVARFDGPPEHCDAVAFSPDGRRLAVAKHQSFWLWEWPGGRVVCEHRSKKFLTDLAYSPDGRFVATSGNDGIVRFRDGTTGEPVTQFDWQIDKALCVAFSPDGLRAAAGGATGAVVVWDVG